MTRNEQFAERMKSLELAVAGIDTQKSPMLSDKGEGVEKLINSIDVNEPLIAAAIQAAKKAAMLDFLKKLDKALVKVESSPYAYSRETLLLIIFNGKDGREDSIRAIMKARKIKYVSARSIYFKHLNVLGELLNNEPLH